MNSRRFGIIRVLPNGIPQWIQAVRGLAEAKAHLMRLASREPGEFFIYSEKNGAIVERFVCVADEQSLDGEPKPKNDKPKPRRTWQTHCNTNLSGCSRPSLVRSGQVAR